MVYFLGMHSHKEIRIQNEPIISNTYLYRYVGAPTVMSVLLSNYAPISKTFIFHLTYKITKLVYTTIESLREN